MRPRIVLAIALAVLAASTVLSSTEQAAPTGAPTLADAHRLFYNARYDAAAALTLTLRRPDSADADAQLANYELHTSSLHFQIKQALQTATDKDKAFKQCAPCADWMKAFLTDIAAGRALAHARLKAAPTDETALFFLGKINLNFVWLQLGTLGRKTGWDEYWEARKSLDAVLKRNPQHLRAKVARAWIDYIVDTRLPRGTRWLLGGGNKKRALATVRTAASTAASENADYFAHVEAGFAHWDLQVREKNLTEATEIARRLARDFPENRELVTFLKANDPNSQP